MILYFYLLLLLFSSHLFGFEITHILKPGNNFESTASNGACGTFISSYQSSFCNPALFSFNKVSKLEIDFSLKADGTSIDAAKDLIFQSPSTKSLKNLFENQSFSSITGNTSLNFFTPYFAINYSPAFVQIDALITNPAAPEISVIYRKRSNYNILSGWKASIDDNNLFQLGIGASISFYDGQQLNSHFTLLDLSLNENNDAIKPKKENGVLGNFGIFIFNQYDYLPNLAVHIKNINSKSKINNSHRDSLIYIQDINQFETTTQLSVGKSWKKSIGYIETNLNIPFENYFGNLIDSTSLSLKYTLTFFTLYASASKYAQTFGMLFKSQMSSVGILYSFEKEIKNYNIDQDHAIYLNAGVAFE